MVDRTLIGPDQEKTETVHKWIKKQDDNIKQAFALNWTISHSVFNAACRYYPGGADQLQNIDWYKIHESKDLGVWSHGGRVYCL